MKLVNLFGAPCAGKTVTAAKLFAGLKSKNINAEPVGEVAKELIVLGNEIQLINQVYILGCQYRKLKDLERIGTQVAISDSPLLLQLIYCKDKPYYNEIAPLILKLNSEFDNINVYMSRSTPYQTFGRVHTEEEATRLAKEILDSIGSEFDYKITAKQKKVIEFLEDEIIKKLTNT